VKADTLLYRFDIALTVIEYRAEYTFSGVVSLPDST